jgi:hypothetical protein
MPSDSVEVSAADWTMGIEIIEYPHLSAVGKDNHILGQRNQCQCPLRA